LTCLFCGDCGTRIIHDRNYNRETLNITGTLDDTSWLRPIDNLWTRSAQPWVAITDGMLNYEGQPEEILPLWERWSQQH
jgi:hypothetical protein